MFGTELDDNHEPATGTLKVRFNCVAEYVRKMRNTVDCYTPTEDKTFYMLMLLFYPARLNISEAAESPVSHSLLRRIVVFSKHEDTKIESKVICEGNLLHETEYDFLVSGFAKRALIYIC